MNFRRAFQARACLVASLKMKLPSSRCPSETAYSRRADTRFSAGSRFLRCALRFAWILSGLLLIGAFFFGASVLPAPGPRCFAVIRRHRRCAARLALATDCDDDRFTPRRAARVNLPNCLPNCLIA